MKQFKRYFPDVLLIIGLYLFCLNYSIYQIEESHEARKALGEMYTLGLGGSAIFQLVLIVCNIVSIIFTAQSKRKPVLQTVYIVFFSLNILWMLWTLM